VPLDSIGQQINLSGSRESKDQELDKIKCASRLEIFIALAGGGSSPGGAADFWASKFYFRGGASSKKRSFFSQSLQNFAIHNGNVLRRVM